MDKLNILLFILLICTVQGGSVIKLPHGMSLEFDVDFGAETLQIIAIYPQNYYLAVGFSKWMTNCPMVIFNSTSDNANDLPAIDDLYSPTYSSKQMTHNDPNQYQQTAFEVLENGNFKVTVVRPMKIEREGRNETIDFDKKYEWNWAFRVDRFGNHGKKNRGLFSFAANSRLQQVSINKEIYGKDMYYYLHGIFFYIIWSLLSFFLIITGRYMRHLYKFRMILHFVIGVLVLAGTIILNIYALKVYIPHKRTNYNHYELGWSIMFITVAQCLVGVVLVKLYSALKNNSKIAFYARYAHMIIGYGVIIISNVQVYYGLILYASPVRYLMFAHFGAYLLMWAACEVVYWVFFPYKKKGVIKDQGHAEFTDDQVRLLIDEGRQLCFFNNFILDVGSFADQHPGNRFTIIDNIGVDIGKFFYGAASMENNVKPYVHSSYAGELIENMIIGKLCMDLDNSTFTYGKSLRLSGGSLISSRRGGRKTNNYREDAKNPLISEENTFVIERKDDLAPDIARVVFQGEDAEVKKYYPDLTLAGKSWSVTSLQNDVSRYYTICNCMGSLIYDEYLKAFKSALDGVPYQRAYKTHKHYQKLSDDTLEMVIKFYSQTRKGISRQVFNALKEDRYYIHGPVGTGLQLNQDHSEGLNVIFAGGTGILPFMDLFAYIGRRLLAHNNPNYAIFQGEKFKDLHEDAIFEVFCYFTKEDEAICLDFITMLEDLHIKYGVGDKFKLNIIFTREGGKKLDDNEIITLFEEYKSKYGGINMAYVCGPPPMCIQFQGLKHKVDRESIGMNPQNLEIL